jgi:FkbM family methyltransferase
MMCLRSDCRRHRRVSRHTNTIGSLCVAFLCFLSTGCRTEEREPALAAQLLHDEAEIAAYLDAFPFTEYQIYDVPKIGKFYLDDNPAGVKARLRSGQPWEPHIIKELEKHVVPGTTVLDVGAHIGSLTVPLAGIVGPKGRVYAFEPQKKVFRELFYNVKLNELVNVTPLRFAVSSEPGIIEMNPVPRGPGGPMRGPDGKVAIGKGGDPVEARTIDSFGFSNVSVIKIDVEGHEAQVLKGAEETIKDFHPVILVEIFERNLDTVRPILNGFGYSLRRITHADYIAMFDADPLR